MNVIEAKPLVDHLDIIRNSIRTAFEADFDIFDPEAQIPQHIRFGVEFLRGNEDVTIEDISDKQIEIWLRCGGTDHP